MPGYAASRATHRISLKPFNDSDDWVDIYAGRTSGADTRVQSAVMELAGTDATGRPIISARVHLDDMRSQLFVESIVAWSLKADDADDGPMPLNRTVFDTVLGDRVAAWLDGEISRYYANRRLSEEQQGNSSGNSSAPSAPVDQFPTPSAGSN